jgi:hypothetical protein
MTTLQQQSQWQVDSQGRRLWQGVEDQEHWYKVQPDGSLRCLNKEPDVPQDTVSAPCCVVFAPLGGPQGQPQQQQQSRGTQREPREVYYLVVRWPDVQVDPSVWGFGPDLGLLQYAVREATRRLVKFKCKSRPGWVPDKGVPL